MSFSRVCMPYALPPGRPTLWHLVKIKFFFFIVYSRDVSYPLSVCCIVCTEHYVPKCVYRMCVRYSYNTVTRRSIDKRKKKIDIFEFASQHILGMIIVGDGRPSKTGVRKKRKKQQPITDARFEITSWFLPFALSSLSCPRVRILYPTDFRIRSRWHPVYSENISDPSGDRFPL